MEKHLLQYYLYNYNKKNYVPLQLNNIYSKLIPIILGFCATNSTLKFSEIIHITYAAKYNRLSLRG